MIVPLFVSTGKRAVAVLTPTQVRLIDEHLNADYKVRTRFLLHTAMRLVEAKYVDTHRETYRKDHHAIFLNKVDGLGKKRCTITNRAVMLSSAGVIAVEDFFDKNVHFPTYQAMEPAIRLAAKEADFDTRYITTKMYRKTMVSWLINCYPERESQILHFAGHNEATMRGHYLTYGFRKEDMKDMKEVIAGWGEM